MIFHDGNRPCHIFDKSIDSFLFQKGTSHSTAVLHFFPSIQSNSACYPTLLKSEVNMSFPFGVILLSSYWFAHWQLFVLFCFKNTNNDKIIGLAAPNLAVASTKHHINFFHQIKQFYTNISSSVVIFLNSKYSTMQL